VAGWRGLGTLSLLAALWAGFLLTSRPVTLVIDGQPRLIRTHRATVSAVTQELGLTLAPEDIVMPPPGTALSSGDSISIQLAQPVTIRADGQTQSLLTHQTTVSQVLAQIGITPHPRDEIRVDDRLVQPGSALPRQPAADTPQGLNPLRAATTPRGQVAAARPAMVHISLFRAVPITLHDGQTTSSFYTTRPTVGQALQQQGVTLYPADKVTPALDAPLSTAAEIRIERSIPVSIKLNDRLIETRTLPQTIGQLLAQEGVVLMGQDFTIPPTDQPVLATGTVEVIRVEEALEITQEFIPFETEWVADGSMPLDQQEVRQSGQNGVIKSRTRIRYENGQEVARELEDEWLDQTPANRLIAYGTQIEIRTLETENGPIEYWRKIPMLTTAYSAATSGKAPDHPRYGLTRIGLQAGYGIVAVDPKVIPLRTNVYVPGYGTALAGDTGGGVQGKHIDLGYNDDEPVPLMYEWRDVYVLTPVPPANKIRYVLPQWPQR